MKHLSLLKLIRYLSNQSRRTEAGFNLVEVVMVVIIAGILAAIIAPSWLAFTNRQRLQASQSNVFRAMQSAQARAKGNRETWQFSFDSSTNPSRWAIHSASVSVDDLISAGEPSGGITENTWYSLEDRINLNVDNSNFETITIDGETGYRILFNERGCPVTEIAKECTESAFLENDSDPVIPARITLTHEKLGETKRCVRVDTILGAMRMADDGECE